MEVLLVGALAVIGALLLAQNVNAASAGGGSGGSSGGPVEVTSVILEEVLEAPAEAARLALPDLEAVRVNLLVQVERVPPLGQFWRNDIKRNEGWCDDVG